MKPVYFAGRVLHSLHAFRLMHRWLVPGKISVLMYHGLVREPLPVPDWCFQPLVRFEEQMEYLTRNFEVVHLEDAFAPGRAPSKRPLACVTFDDGFASVRELALPVLEELRVPATVYLVTGLLDSTDTVWFARLHQAICETQAREVRLGDLRFPLEGTAARAEASAGLQVAIKKLDRPAFESMFEDVLTQLGFGGENRAKPWDAFRLLTSDEVRSMSRSGLVRFGGHTSGHQILTRTTREDARCEVEQSVRAVAALVERPSRTFAYPNGGPDDFDDGVAAAVRDAGIDFAVTTIEGPNGPDQDPYRILRYGIGAADPLPRFAGLVHHARDRGGGVPLGPQEKAMGSRHAVRSIRLLQVGTVLAGLLACGSSAPSEQPAPPSDQPAPPSADPATCANCYVWRPLRIGAGGWLTGIDMSTDGSTKVVRADTYGAYVWDSGQWRQLVTSGSMPTEDVAPEKAAGVWEIRVAPGSPGRLYMSYRGRVYRSSDRGGRWARTAFAPVKTDANDDYRTFGQKMAVDPANADVVYVGSPKDGLFVSADAGATWHRVATVPPGEKVGVAGIAFDPTSGTAAGRTKTVYASSYGNGVWRTTDAGTTWARVAGGPLTVNHAVVAADGALYVTENDGSANTVWRLTRDDVAQGHTPGQAVLAHHRGGPAEPRPHRGLDRRRVPRPERRPRRDVERPGVEGERGARPTSRGSRGRRRRTCRTATCASTRRPPARCGLPRASGCGRRRSRRGWGRSRGPRRAWESSSSWPTRSPRPPGRQARCWPRGIARSSTAQRRIRFPSQHGPNNEHAIVMGMAVDYASTDPTFLAAVADFWGVEQSCYSTDGGRTWTVFPSIPTWPDAGRPGHARGQHAGQHRLGPVQQTRALLHEGSRAVVAAGWSLPGVADTRGSVGRPALGVLPEPAHRRGRPGERGDVLHVPHARRPLPLDGRRGLLDSRARRRAHSVLRLQRQAEGRPGQGGPPLLHGRAAERRRPERTLRPLDRRRRDVEGAAGRPRGPRVRLRQGGAGIELPDRVHRGLGQGSLRHLVVDERGPVLDAASATTRSEASTR